MIHPGEFDKLMRYGDELGRCIEAGLPLPKPPVISYEPYDPGENWHKTAWAGRLFARIKNNGGPPSATAGR